MTQEFDKELFEELENMDEFDWLEAIVSYEHEPIELSEEEEKTIDKALEEYEKRMSKISEEDYFGY